MSIAYLQIFIHSDHTCGTIESYKRLCMADKFLNPQQLEAIHHGKGPLLIIAGAGTGKTTVITERIKYLITKENIDPEHILALTFTEKASFEMEERVDRIMPYGYTKLWIGTFHSFCDSLLRLEGINFGITTSYKLMGETESVLFLKKNIFKLNLDYFRPLGNPTKFLESLLVHFARLSDEDITPEEYIQFAEAQKKELEVDSTEKERREEIRKIVELAYAYQVYEQLKIKEGVIDFSNLISLTLRMLRNRPNILKKYQDQFQYILVDEFQDTNYAQNELAMLLSGNRKNITVVADDDQAIYRWRGAALSNVIQFKNNFPNGKIITLSKNYRSTQRILDRSYQLIQNNNPNRLEAIENINKKLTSERKIKGSDIVLLHTKRVDEEAEVIAQQIQKLVGEHKQGKYTYRDIAILVRANNHAQPITQTLQRLKIPYQFLGPGQLFLQEDIKDLIAYMKVLYDLEDSVSLFRVLNMDVFGISARDINYLLNSSKKRNITLFQTLEKVEDTYLSDGTKEKVKILTTMILRHLERVKKDTAGQILYYFLVDTKLFEKYTQFSTEKEEQITQNIAKFFDKIKTFETINQDRSIYAVVDWIDLMMEMGDSPLVSEVDWRDANAVNILTIHSSKGLEFPVVFMVNLVVDRFPTRERKEKIPLPPQLIKEILPSGDYHLQEERRLFYVGMTRARDLLYFTAASFYAEGKREKKISPFVYEALPEELKKQEELVHKPTQLSLIEIMKEYQENSFPTTTIKDDGIPPLKLNWVSYSQLQSFDMCPLHFKARYILNIPTAATAPLSFGSSLHNAMKDYYDAIKNNKTIAENDIKLFLSKNWISEGYTEKTHEQYSLKKAETIMMSYHDKYYKLSSSVQAVEVPFSFYLNPNLRLTGKIDRIDVLPDGKIEIIDYKTGAADSAYKSLYKFQLGLYALAATRVQNNVFRKNPEDIIVSLYYLESDEKISEQITSSELLTIENKIKEKVQEIEKSKFFCSKSIFCSNCEYKMLCSTL